MKIDLKKMNDYCARVSDYEKVESVCPYCGVGCQIEYNIKENKIAYVDGVNGPANKNRLCVKGRFGFDYVNHPERLKKPKKNTNV